MAVSSASFTTVGDTLEHFVAEKGTLVQIDQSDADQQTVLFQREVGSKGSGTWLTLITWTSGSAVVLEQYKTRYDNENLRLNLTLDGGGTNAVVLTDSDDLRHSFKTPTGTVLMELRDSGMDISGSVRHASNPVDETGATLTITAELHAGRVVTLNRAAGVSCTLPAATGTGNVYTFYVGTLNTSVGNVIKVANSSDTFGGGIMIVTDIAGVVINTNTDTDTITLGGSDTTTGGLIGTWMRCTDVATGEWMLEGVALSAGTESTPFSAGI